MNQDEFREVDYPVMGCAFQTHNELGSLFDEQIDRDELKYRLQKQFESVETEMPTEMPTEVPIEVPIEVQCESFSPLHYFAI